tara:strand:- start:116 stop:349 length:234 start_codon:yes stop_codon:yes gene_type:complete
MKYGKSEQERKAEESLQCRKIVQEIINFGVTESQKLKIIQLLSLELVDRNAMLEISSIMKEYLNNEVSEKKKIIEID